MCPSVFPAFSTLWTEGHILRIELKY